MNKRIVLKTILICIGIFLILVSAGIYFFSSRYELDTEKKYQVVLAAVDITAGSVITENMVSYKTVKESGFTPHMLQNSEQVVGMKTLSPILKGDYISQYSLLPPDKWHKMMTTLYIKNTVEAVEFYKEAFGMTLGYNEKFPDGSFTHAELLRDGHEVFAVSESQNDTFVNVMLTSSLKESRPTMSYGITLIAKMK